MTRYNKKNEKGRIDEEQPVSLEFTAQGSTLDMVKQGPLGTYIHALAAFCAGGLNRSFIEALFVNGERRADRNALFALYAFILVKAYLEDICLIGK